MSVDVIIPTTLPSMKQHPKWVWLFQTSKWFAFPNACKKTFIRTMRCMRIFYVLSTNLTFSQIQIPLWISISCFCHDNVYPILCLQTRLWDPIHLRCAHNHLVVFYPHLDSKLCDLADYLHLTSIMNIIIENQVVFK